MKPWVKYAAAGALFSVVCAGVIFAVVRARVQREQLRARLTAVKSEVEHRIAAVRAILQEKERWEREHGIDAQSKRISYELSAKRDAEGLDLGPVSTGPTDARQARVRQLLAGALETYRLPRIATEPGQSFDASLRNRVAPVATENAFITTKKARSQKARPSPGCKCQPGDPLCLCR